MNCLIVEDEKMAAERLKKLITEAEPSVTILEVTQSVKQTVAWLNQNPRPQLVFMDIQLADGLSFEVFEQVEANFPIIFTTAFDEYALKAFKHNGIDYLLKPIQLPELKQAIAKYKLHYTPTPAIPGHVFDSLMRNIAKTYKSKFAIKIGEHIRIIPIEQVQCFYAMDKAVFLQTTEGRHYDLNYTLDQLDEMIDPAKFFRISRKHTVALASITDIVAYSNSRLLLKLAQPHPDELVVSRERVKEFKDWIEQ